MYLELKHLRTLKTLQQTGSLVAAARRLHLTQSALSHQLRVLEARFGVALVIRKSRPVTFTPAGRRLLDLAEQVLPQVEAAERDLARLGGGQAGRLFIVIECHSCFEWLLPTMDAYRTEWPEVEMDLTLGFSFEPLPALLRGDVDWVVTSDPQPLAGIAYEPLFAFQALLAVAKDHPLARKDWIAPEDLAYQTLITYPVERQRLDVFRNFLDPAGVQPAAQRTCELTAMMLQLVASRRGVCVLPNWALAEYLARDYVAARPLGPQPLWGTLYAAVRESERELAYVKGFLETARRVSFETLRGIRAVGD
ncbi:LysR family transcriptional regulator, regulator for metE and metH [Methylomarinovum caldicuralii]|uniref:HTH-type transcriptional regulator MetR n=1 Tax=Methylomarinovum caldicuralii TaxID=438856 RepID=A0AAU9CUN1_9GAMM|nr:LysR family transcriptional regulator [Methylomarinovum caldicuralii]BCX81622.1 LysR family transcriptional regulator, regulator for metE and metH [Methylomarinovum caldicuralii]